MMPRTPAKHCPLARSGVAQVEPPHRLAALPYVLVSTLDQGNNDAD